MKAKKWEMRSILRVKPLKGFKLQCHFDNGEVRVFDMDFIRKEKGEMIRPLKSPKYFKRVFIEMGVPTWPNGYDVCADFVYRNSVLFNDETSEVAS